MYLLGVGNTDIGASLLCVELLYYIGLKIKQTVPW